MIGKSRLNRRLHQIKFMDGLTIYNIEHCGYKCNSRNGEVNEKR